MTIIKGKGGIEAEVLLGTTSPYTCFPAIWTLRLKFPRFILAQFSKHRMFSFNSTSSRAVSIPKMLKKMEQNPMTPVYWGKSQKGMTGEHGHNALLTDGEGSNGYSVCLENDKNQWGLTPEEAWDDAKNWSIAYAESYHKAGYHQEIPNRLLEPFQHIEIIVTATDWYNFFALRLAPDAQGEIQELARAMKQAIDTYHMQWPRMGCHIPMVSDDEVYEWGPDLAMKVSAARCCTISYYNHKGEPMGVESAEKLYNHLVHNDGQVHATPLEHQAIVPNGLQYGIITSTQEHLSSLVDAGSSDKFRSDVERKIKQLEYFANFHGWVSNRYLIGQ